MDPQQPEHTHCKCALASAIQPSLVVTTSGAGAEQHTQTELRTYLQSEVSPCLGPAEPQREPHACSSSAYGSPVATTSEAVPETASANRDESTSEQVPSLARGTSMSPSLVALLPWKISANQRRYAHLSSELPLPLLSRRLLWFLFWHLLLRTCTKSAELALPGQSAGFAQSVRTVLRRRTSCCRLSEMEASQCSPSW